jgi:hypothetical protein
MARIEEGKLAVAMLRAVGGVWAREANERVVEILRKRERARVGYHFRNSGFEESKIYIVDIAAGDEN